MRKKVKNQHLTVNAVSGTYVVMLGMSMKQSDCDSLRGFAIERGDRATGKKIWLRGLKTFEGFGHLGKLDAGYSTQVHPIQGFSWSDYIAEPGHKYTYRVIAMKGQPGALTPFSEVSVDIDTESPEGGDHDVYFNRGVAGSQAYAYEFKNESPRDVGQKAFDWLSRGLVEGIVSFISRAKGKSYALRVAAYELHSLQVLDALKAAADRGVDLKIIYDRRGDKPGKKNDAAIKTAGLSKFCKKRIKGASYISHNKFIVLLRNGKPQSVLTGGTNFSEGGIFGHSNVSHVVEDQEIAREFLEYWELLVKDPETASFRKVLSQRTAIPAALTSGKALPIFSPRSADDALRLYASIAKGAKDALFMTFAFGMHELFQDAYANGSAALRFATMETEIRAMKAGPDRDAELQKIKVLRAKPQNRFAIGAHLTESHFDRWLAESLSGLNSHVRYIHNKFLITDPLSDDPIVIFGSANFSKASSTDNDENMIAIRGNTRVADVYLGEFFRMYAHHAWRDFLKHGKTTADLKHLRLDDWWKEYFGSGPRSRQRAYFAQTFDH
jgi:phosphatidylserine/phosphatidylglycerophosphate/cardiolipin synthase-like enzyme